MLLRIMVIMMDRKEDNMMKVENVRVMDRKEDNVMKVENVTVIKLMGRLKSQE